MPDLIPPGGMSAQDPSQPPQAGADPSQGSAATPAQGPSNDPSQAAPAGPQGQAADGADDGGARPVGTVQQANDATLEDDPYAQINASPEEEAQYTQFMSRFLLAISINPRQEADPKGPNLHKEVMKMLNNSDKPAAVTIGQTTATVAFMIVQQAQHAGIKYDPDVLFHANFEACASVYLLGVHAGIIKGVEVKDFDQDGGYPFDQKDLRIVAESQVQASRFFGNLALRAGMISDQDSKDYENFWQKQVQREIKTGQVPEHVIQMMHQSGIGQHVQAAAQDQMSAANAAQQPDMGQMQAQQGGPAQPQPGPQAPPPGGGDQGGQQPGLIPPGAQ